MGTSIFIAKILGPILLIVATGITVNRDLFHKALQDFYQKEALMFYNGILALIVSLMIVVSHNIWVADWNIIITIFGWLGIAKGILLIIFPNIARKIMQFYQKSKLALKIHSIVIFILGIILTSFAYFIESSTLPTIY